MAAERVVPKEKQKSWCSQSLMGPYEASQTRINVSIIFFLPASSVNLNILQHLKNYRSNTNRYESTESCTQWKTKKFVFTITNGSIWSFTSNNKRLNNFILVSGSILLELFQHWKNSCKYNRYESIESCVKWFDTHGGSIQYIPIFMC